MAKNQLIALEASSASIKTASVTIRTLRVDGRQLTMGTFRQLRQRPAIDERAVELLGTVWGWVNYNPDADPRMTQFVVQFGEELCRSPVWVHNIAAGDRSGWPGPLEALRERNEALLRCKVFDGAIRGDDLPEYGPSANYRYMKEFKFPLMGIPPFPSYRIAIDFNTSDKSIHEAFLRILYPRQVESSCHKDHAEGRRVVSGSEVGNHVECIDMTESEMVEAGRDRLREAVSDEGFDPGESAAEWDRRIADNARIAGDYIVRWNALMGRFRSVEQLFIAT